jgi:hypothetical protein
VTAPPPPLLNYDPLPDGSDIRVEIGNDAGVRITVPAGEPPREALKQTAYEALAIGATQSWALLLLAVLIFMLGIRANRVSGAALMWAWAFFAVFCAAIVLLVSWVRYGMLLDAIRLGRRQVTVMAATRERLLIETSGPFGARSVNLPAAAVMNVRSGKCALRDDRGTLRRVNALLITVDNQPLHFLPARDPRELRAIIALVHRGLS